MKILDYFSFINEGLIKTHDHTKVLSNSDFFLSKLKINYLVKYNPSKNAIELTIDNFNNIGNLSGVFDCIDSFFINMMGWFPSTMYITNLSGMNNILPYNKKYLIDVSNFTKSVTIQYESKYDIEKSVPLKLYHLSILQFKDKILNNGLSPKSKGKLVYHPDRIYLCDNLVSCKSLIPQMKFSYNSSKWNNPKSNINDKWIIYEVDTNGLDLRLFIDPNYIGGYYIIQNIPPYNIKIVESEK